MPNLTRESQDCFREPPSGCRERGLAYYRFQQIFRVTVRSPQRAASNLCDQDLKLVEYLDFQEAWREAIKQGRNLPSRPMFQESDPARISHKINGEGSSRDRLSTISELGESNCAERMLFHIIKDKTGSISFIAYHDTDSFGFSKGFHFWIYLNEDRFDWIWSQIGDRPNAELRLDLYFEAFEHEAEEALYEPLWRRNFFLEATNGTEIHGVSLHVVDTEIDPTAADGV